MTLRLNQTESISVIARVLAAISAPRKTDLLFKGISPADCHKISGRIEQLGLRGCCEYYAKYSLLVIKPMPSPVHECVQDWIHHVINQMQYDMFIPWRDWLNRISRNVGMGKLSSILAKCIS